jgi:AraC family transcriptional regulator
MAAREHTTRCDGPRAVGQATVGSLEIFHLRFPASFRHGVVDPERGYLAVPLVGAVRKTFGKASATLSRGCFMSIPAGAAHASTFAPRGFDVLVLRATDERGVRLFGGLLARRVQVAAEGAGVLAWRLASELRCRDVASELALEGIALELLAQAARAGTACEPPHRGRWLVHARELIEGAVPRTVSLQELAEDLDRHPSHVARAFRRAYGLSVGEYARARRLEWATAAVASTDDPLSRIAVDAGFADQSHLTRWFRRHHGTTPARYRALVRS